jgi:hypothetical protein
MSTWTPLAATTAAACLLAAAHGGQRADGEPKPPMMPGQLLVSQPTRAFMSLSTHTMW